MISRPHHFALAIFILSWLVITPPAHAGWLEEAREKAEEIVDEAKDKAEETAEKAKEKASEAKDKAEETAEKAKEKAKETVANTKEKVSDTIATTKETVKETAAKVKTAVTTAKETASEKISTAKTNVQEKAAAIKEGVKDAATTAKDKILATFAKLKEASEDVRNTVTAWASGELKTFPANQILVVLKDDADPDVLNSSTTATVIKEVYKKYGTPSVTQLYPYEDQEAVESRVEIEILQPYDVRWKLKKHGYTANLTIPPLHLFYVLEFAATMTDSERDKAIEKLATSSKIRHATKNYIAKLEARPGDELYSESLIWFKPYAQSWWDVDDATATAVLIAVDTENLYLGMELLYPESAASESAKSRSRTLALKTTYDFDSKLVKTHFQFPGRPAFAKDACPQYVDRSGKTVAAKPAKAATKTKSKAKKTPTLALKTDAAAIRCRQSELLVRYANDATAAERQEIESALGLKKIRHFPLAGTYHYEIGGSQSVTDVLEALQERDEIFYAEPNYVRSGSFTPDDPDYTSGKTWHHTLVEDGGKDDIGIGSPGAWDYTTGDESVIVAVIDSGMSISHTDLGNNAYVNTTEAFYDYSTDGDGWSCAGDGCCYTTRESNKCVDADGQGYKGDIYGWNFYDNTPYVEDYCGHGTAIAGLIGAASNGFYTVGVAPDVTIMPVKAGDCVHSDKTSSISEPAITISDSLAAIEYAAKHGAKVINLSYGGYDMYNETEEDLIKSLSSVLFTVAVGNESVCIDPADKADATTCPKTYQIYPANYDASGNIITVGSSDKSGGLSSFSNWGKTNVDILAPGEDIYSLWRYSSTSIDDGTSGLIGDGTSYAAPLAAGTAALMYSRCSGMTPQKIKDIIIKTAFKATGELDDITVSGGILDAKEALEECLNLNDGDSSNDDLGECGDEELAQEAACQAVANDAGRTESACTAAGGVWLEPDPADKLGEPVCLCSSCDARPISDYNYSCALNPRAAPPSRGRNTALAAFVTTSWWLALWVLARRRSARQNRP